jgi:hypothetical protein
MTTLRSQTCEICTRLRLAQGTRVRPHLDQLPACCEELPFFCGGKPPRQKYMRSIGVAAVPALSGLSIAALLHEKKKVQADACPWGTSLSWACSRCFRKAAKPWSRLGGNPAVAWSGWLLAARPPSCRHPVKGRFTQPTTGAQFHAPKRSSKPLDRGTVDVGLPSLEAEGS